MIQNKILGIGSAILLAFFLVFQTKTEVAPQSPQLVRAPIKKEIKKATPAIPASQGKIAAYIYHIRPSRGKAFAHHLAKRIYTEAVRNNICPYWVAATGKVESNYDMSDGPQIGYMQFTRIEGREMAHLYGWNVRDPDDNVRAGARYLRQNLSSRGAGGSRNSRISSTSAMFRSSAIYNDGPRGMKTHKGLRYANNVMKARTIIMSGSWRKQKHQS